MPSELTLRVPRDRLPPLTAFGMTLLLTILCWGALYEFVRLGMWLWKLL